MSHGAKPDRRPTPKPDAPLPAALQEGSSQHPDRSSGEGGNNDSNSRSASRQRANRRYDLTGETGSYRYMAPEVFRHEPYNSKVRYRAVCAACRPCGIARHAPRQRREQA